MHAFPELPEQNCIVVMIHKLHISLLAVCGYCSTMSRVEHHYTCIYNNNNIIAILNLLYNVMMW